MIETYQQFHGLFDPAAVPDVLEFRAVAIDVRDFGFVEQSVRGLVMCAEVVVTGEDEAR